MRRAVRSWHVWAGLVLAAVFWTTVHYVPNASVLLVTNSLVLSGSAAVGIAYMPVAWHAIRHERSARVQRIVLGIMYSWTFSALWRIWSLLWLTSGQEPWMVNNDVVAFFQAGVFLGAVYHLISPGAIGGARGDRMPSLKWITVGVVCGLAVMLAALLAYLNPDTTRFVHAIKPYVPR